MKCDCADREEGGSSFASMASRRLGRHGGGDEGDGGSNEEMPPGRSETPRVAKEEADSRTAPPPLGRLNRMMTSENIHSKRPGTTTPTSLNAQSSSAPDKEIKYYVVEVL